MNKRNFILFLLLTLFGGIINASAQAKTVLGQISSSISDSFVGGMSGDGRFVVVESNGNLATENPRNSDANREIFLFDYAQRRIYQITNTKVVPINPNVASGFFNTRVEVINTRPVISNDGKWLAFTSNATTSVPGSPVNGTNPGNFDGNSFSNLTSGASQLDVSTVTASTTMSNIVQPAVPSTVRINFTDLNTSITAFSVTVAGTNASNVAISENFTFSGGLVQNGTQVFTTVTSVTLNSISGNSAGDTLDFFYGNGNNPLTTDGNMETWLYQIPTVTPVDLSQGLEITPVDLSAGAFTQITNTQASSLPVAGSISQLPRIASDQSDASISDDGSVTAFVSNRNLVGTGNQAPNDNPEIFVFNKDLAGGTTSQVTQTPRGPISVPIRNSVPTISGNGLRVMFASNANNPIVGMTGGNNADTNLEVFFSDLDPSGVPTGTKKQVSVTTPTNEGQVVNIVNFGRRMSRDGKYIAFDSYADITNEHSGANQLAFGTFLYNADTDTFRRIGERSDADAAAPGGDVDRHPTFTDYVAGSPQTLVLETRMNITPQGTIPTSEGGGLNPIPQRPTQVYSYPLDEAPTTAIFTRITQLPPPPFSLGSYQMYPSNSLKRMAITIPSTEIGTGNPGFPTQAYYFLKPDVISETPATMNFSTGATNIPVTNAAVPTPTPTPSPLPSPEPIPQTPPVVRGLSAGMLATVRFEAGINQPVTAVTAVGSLNRRFTLPMELGGVTMSINGITVGLKSVSRRQITFVVPPALGANDEIPFDIVINNNGIEIKGEIILVLARPDIFRSEINPEANRARAFNITNRVQTREPFNVRTLRYRGGVKIPTVIRVYLTGVQNLQGNSILLRLGSNTILGTRTDPVLVEPGIYTMDVTLNPELDMIGDQPLVIAVSVGGNNFFGRLDNDAPRVRIL